MQDPSFGVHRELIPHVHLVSTYRFPLLQQLHPEKVAEWLLTAPKIAKHTAPFYWTYLDRPADGTILLTWQSMNALNADFASDGYVWTPAETAFSLEVSGGYTLEMYHAKAGYGPGESYARHTRRRYRLLPSKNPDPNDRDPPDLSLWIVHYSQAAQQDLVPSSVIPIDGRIQNIMSTRAYLQTQGQIVQKEFMLYDRASWPQIQFPRSQNQSQMMYGIPQPVRTPQTMAYPTQNSVTAPPAKRARTQASAAQNVPGVGPAGVLDAGVEDEEDTSRGDLFDHLTTREISTERYKLNHQWMEEILSSPYSVNQIIPVDLGLGLRGELSNLTEGIFDAPMDPKNKIVKHNYVGRLEADKADEFRKRANEHITQTDREIEKMKAKHARRLEKFKKGSLLTLAEKELRTAVDDPTNTGPEYWRLEGKIDEDDGENGKTISKAPQKVDDILAQVEASLGRHTVALQELRRIQDGGYEEAPALPSPHISPVPSRNGSHQSGVSGVSGVLVGDTDMDMGESTAAGLLDQFHTGLSSNSTPGNSLNFPTPQLQMHTQSATGTPSNLNIPSPQPATDGTPVAAPVEKAQADVDMAEVSNATEPAPSTDATGTGDWVVVPSGGVSPVVSTSAQNTETVPATAPATTTEQPQAVPQNESPLIADQDLHEEGTPGFEGDSNDFGDLGDLDTAGEALAGYGGSDMGGDDAIGGDLDLGMDLGMDDSAFGEAFHGVEARGTEGDGEIGDVDGL